MATVSELIAEKTKRLTTVPDEFLSAVEKSQKAIFPQIIDLLSQLERDAAGNFVLSNANLLITASIKEKLQQILSESEYIDAVGGFAKEFNVQAKISDALFAKSFDGFNPSTSVENLLKLNQRTSVDLLVNSIGNQRFADVVRETIETAVSNNSGFTDTVKALQTLVTGDDQTDGKLLQYSKQIAHDTFAIADRNYTSAASTQLDAEWFFYSGSEIETTRPFCVTRHNHYYYYKEIESWADMNWAGKIPETNETTIYSYAGGYNCRHSIIPVSIRRVPKEVIIKAMDKYGFEPTNTEKDLLGL